MPMHARKKGGGRKTGRKYRHRRVVAPGTPEMQLESATARCSRCGQRGQIALTIPRHAESHGPFQPATERVCRSCLGFGFSAERAGREASLVKQANRRRGF